ncbi:MAG: AraC family transcriptional regulator [Faecalibacterium prausnitzii]|nr:MAG: AraC family transcriptional regulator [Faecalibacterium prausnitzii]
MVNYTAKRYLFEQSTVREFFSGAYYDLFLVIRGSGVFRCSEVVLPAQQQNLIILKPGQGGRLEYAGAYGPLEIIRVQLSPQMLAQLSDEDTDFEKSFNVVPFRQVAVRPDSQIYMLLKNLARKLLVLPQESSQFGAAAFEHGILQMFVVLAMLDEVFLFIQSHLTEDLTLERLEKEFFVSREHIAREFKRQTGQTVHRYIVKARLDRCCALIEQGLPITEVYKTSGFGGYNHFFRAFKKEYGMTPKEYFSTTRQDARG